MASALAAAKRGEGARVEDPRVALARYLVDSRKVSADAIARAEQLSRETREHLEVILPRLGMISERDLTDAIAATLDLPVALPSQFPDSPILEDKLTRNFLVETRLLPIEDHADRVAIAMANPLDEYAAEAVRFAVGRSVIRYAAHPADLDAALQRLYGDGRSELNQILGTDARMKSASDEDDIDKLKDIASDAPVIRLVNQLIARAVEARASDIHIEPMEDALRIRYRIDGVLHPVDSPPPQRLASAVISRIKIMAKLNIAERRAPQDGRINLAVRGRDVDFRVATTPTIHGESLVLRILDRNHLKLDFAALGFEETLTKSFRALLSAPHGIFLVTGPTGSGKTTTLYTALAELNEPSKKILTVEDPVEFQLDGINQVQVKPQIGLTFASALRAFLRQDPDIVMVGEIRDLETAQIAVQAALTGHLILSTLHTNDAASAIARLIDMGVEDYLLVSTINGIAGQRLVRALCDSCREPYAAMPELVQRWGLADAPCEHPVTLYRPVGCEACSHTGYRGRTSIVELLTATEGVRKEILASRDTSAIARRALNDGMRTMRAHGFAKALAGTTTVDEVLRVTRSI